MKSSEQNALKNRTRWTSAWPAFVLLAGLLTGHCARAATTHQWNVASDLYNNSAAWNPAGVPVAADTADIGNSGTVLYDSTMTNALAILLMGEAGSGTFTMSGGELDITNNTANGFLLGNAASSVATFTMNGGKLTLLRNASTFFQDDFQPGFGAGSSGTFTLNNGTANFLCGIEIGINGQGTINVNGGTLIDNGWFGLGRGGTTGWGVFNLAPGGTVYLLRNPGTEGITSGIAFCQGGTNGTVNISGGTLYAGTIRFASPTGPTHNDTETLNISGGDIYLGNGGVVLGTGVGTKTISINLSGGTFRTVNLGLNTGGTQGTNSIAPGGTNWTWAAALPASLNTSPGPGIVAFVPDTGKTITLSSPFSGAGALTFNGPGTNVLTAANTYSGGTTLSQGTLAFGTGGSILDSTPFRAERRSLSPRATPSRTIPTTSQGRGMSW